MNFNETDLLEMNTFKAAVLENLGKPLIIKELKIPKLEFGQVLVKLKYSGVCRSQLMEVQGLRGKDKYLPHLLGHEGVGTVLKVGSGVTKVTVGDKVIVGWINSSGITAANPIFFDDKGLTINAGASTTFSELSVVSENRLYLQPDFVPDKLAALFGCSLLTGAGMVLNEITPQQNQSVLVLGLGGVGFPALLATLSINPRLIISADISEEKRNKAKSLGIKHVLDSANSSFVQDVKDLTNGGVDISYECAGSTESIEKAFACLKVLGGKLIFSSHPTFGEKIRIDPYELIQGKTLKGSWGGGSKPDTDIPKIANILLHNSLKLEEIIGNIYSLDQVNEALMDLIIGNSGRPLIKM